MELVRFAVIGLSRPAPARVLGVDYGATNGIHVQVGAVHDAELVHSSEPSGDAGLTVMWPAQSAEVLVSVQSSVKNVVPRFDEARRVVIDSTARRQAEFAIQEFADTLAIAHQCRRTVRSPRTCVALASQDGDLADAVEAVAEESSSTARPRILPGLCIDKMGDLAWGRAEGVQLLANSLSEESVIGRARDLYRLIEAAFGDSIGALKKPLYEFLKTTPYPMNFEKKETDRWVALRGKVMHGDVQVASSADVAPILSRMEWAAFDLLLHKKLWRSKDTHRRAGIQMLSGVSVSGGLTLFSPQAALQVEWMDPFGMFALDNRMSVALGGSKVIEFPTQPTSAPVDMD